MKAATLLTTALVLTTSAGQPKVTFRCADFRKQPDGTWIALQATPIVIANAERKTLDEMLVDEGTRIPPDSKVSPPAKDDVLAHFFDEDTAGIDFVGELDKQCR